MVSLRRVLFISFVRFKMSLISTSERIVSVLTEPLLLISVLQLLTSLRDIAIVYLVLLEKLLIHWIIFTVVEPVQLIVGILQFLSGFCSLSLFFLRAIATFLIF